MVNMLIQKYNKYGDPKQQSRIDDVIKEKTNKDLDQIWLQSDV